jgi:hypothetical protein
VIGNSISIVQGTPGTDWDHTSGMAASDAAHDWVHLVAAGLKSSSVSVSNFADLERNPADPINKIDLATPMATQIATHAAGIDAHTIVVVELGDNAPQGGSADFTANYGKLLDAVSARAALACTGTFWFDPVRDAMIKAACEAHGGHYVFIGNIRPDPSNRDFIDGPQFSAAINGHPHDWSMAVIAKRVLAALQ